MSSPVSSRSPSPDVLVEVGDFFTPHSPEKDAPNPPIRVLVETSTVPINQPYQDPKRYAGRSERLIFVNEPLVFPSQPRPQTTPTVSIPRFTYESKSHAIPKTKNPQTTPTVATPKFTYRTTRSNSSDTMQRVFRKAADSNAIHIIDPRKPSGSISENIFDTRLEEFRVGAPPSIDYMTEERAKRLHALFHDDE